jgi:hypothetical protein
MYTICWSGRLLKDVETYTCGKTPFEIGLILKFGISELKTNCLFCEALG